MSCVPSFADGSQQKEIALHHNMIRSDKLIPVRFLHQNELSCWMGLHSSAFWRACLEVKNDDGECNGKSWVLFCCNLAGYLNSRFQDMCAERLFWKGSGICICKSPMGILMWLIESHGLTYAVKFHSSGISQGPGNWSALMFLREFQLLSPHGEHICSAHGLSGPC